MTPPSDRDYDTLQVTRLSSGATHLQLDRRVELNAITLPLLTELEDALDALSDEEEPHPLIMSGTGTRAFSVGADLEVIENLDAASAIELSGRGQRTFGKLERFPGPVIASIDGYCLGGGMELVTCADLRIASPDATFAQPEIEQGLIPGWGGTQRLPRLIGEARATEVVLTGNEYDADTMADYGFVTEITEPPFERARDLADSLTDQSQAALKYAKQAIRGGDDRSETGLEFESLAFGHLIRSGAPEDG